MGQPMGTLSNQKCTKDLGMFRGAVPSSIALNSFHYSSTATVLVSRGCLTPGAHILAGTASGKVRLMSDSSGAPVKAAYPGMAVTVSGWRSLPDAGNEVVQASEGDVKKALVNRIRKKEVETVLVDAEAINVARAAERERLRSEEDKRQGLNSELDGGPKELRLVIKGDVSGSVEAVVGALEGIGNKLARVKVVSTGVGDVMESDVMMAKAAEGKDPNPRSFTFIY